MDPKEGDYVRFKHERVETTGTVIKRSGMRIRVQPKDGGATLWKELSELLPLASAVDEASEVAELHRLFSSGPPSSTRAIALSARGVQAAAKQTVSERPNKIGMPTPVPKPAVRPNAFHNEDDTKLDDIDDDLDNAVRSTVAIGAPSEMLRVRGPGCAQAEPFIQDLDGPPRSPSLAVEQSPEATPEDKKVAESVGAPSEMIRALSGLDDRLADALRTGDIKLLRVSWLRKLRRLLRQPDWRSLKRRQELEDLRAESPFLSAEEAVALLRRGTRGVGALTHGWLSPGECDPDGARLDVMLAALDEHPHIEGVFWDYASLFQNLPDRERTPDERAAFGRAIMVMADVYASAVGTTVLQSREIPPRPEAFDGALCLFGLKATKGEGAVRETLGCFGAIVAFEHTRNPPVVRFASHEAALAAKRAGPWPELCDGVDTLYNERPYDERGWCVFENAVSYELLARLGAVPRVREALDALPSKVLVLRSGQPTEPGVAPTGQLETRVAEVVASIERATFTGKGDKDTVPALYREYVVRIVSVVQSVFALVSGGAMVAPAKLPPLPQVEAPAASALRLAEGQPLLLLSWQGSGAGGGPRFGVVDATGGRVAAAVTGGDDAELAYDRCSQAVLPWRPPAAGWDAAFVGDARALRCLAEPARRLADDARRMESESALRAVGERACAIADGAARCQTIALAAREAGAAVQSCVDAAAALFSQGDPKQLQAALDKVRAAIERLQPSALEAALTAALLSSGASGARCYAAGQPLTVRTAGGWRDADVATAGADGLCHRLKFEGPSREPPATLMLHPWNHAPRELPHAAFEAMRAWWAPWLGVQHAHIADALTGKRLDALQQCVAMSVTGPEDVVAPPVEFVLTAPPGKIGIGFEGNGELPPTVNKVLPTSPFLDQIQVGWALVKLDGADVTKHQAQQVINLLNLKLSQVRVLSFDMRGPWRGETPPAPREPRPPLVKFEGADYFGASTEPGKWLRLGAAETQVSAIRDANSLTAWLLAQHGTRLEGGPMEGPRAVLLTAGPASGKTTLLSQVVTLALQDERTELVPILVKVQVLQQRLLEAPDAFAVAWNYIDAFLRLEHEASCPALYRMLRQAMMARRALLLLDGLDEAGAKRDDIERHVVEVLAPQGHVLLCTSRPAGVVEARFAAFRRLALAPLSDAQQERALEQRLGAQRAAALLTYVRDVMPRDDMG